MDLKVHMTETIKNLINDHRTMLTLLKRSKSNKLTDEERSAYLLTVKSLLQNHLEYEDKNLYPKIKELSLNRDYVLETVMEFTSGLEKLGFIINNFFSKYEKEPGSLINNSDFAKIIKLLEVRIHKEELKLYPLYDQLIKEKNN